MECSIKEELFQEKPILGGLQETRGQLLPPEGCGDNVSSGGQ